MNFRFFFIIILFCLLPLTPWWLLVFLVFGAILWFPSYWEVFIICFLYDLAFGLPSGWLGTQFTFTIIFAIWYLLVEGLRDNFIGVRRLNTP